MSDIPEPVNVFPTTRWTSVIQAMQLDDTAKASAALQVFCEQYRDVIFRFFLRRYGPELAENYTQEFFFRKIQEKWNERQGLLFEVKREPGGKFRRYLISSLVWFVYDQGKAKRDPLKNADTVFPDTPTSGDEDQIARECDQEVAFALVRRVTKRLQLSEVSLQYFSGRISADEAAAKLEISPNAFRVAAHRLIPKIRKAFREEVRGIVTSEEEVDDEIQHLLKIVAEKL